jgi:radical SAM protein with 4Fe4S-binding SPASM domain
MNNYCKKAKLTLNFDMNGMVMPCELTDYYLEKNDGSKFNVLTDDVKEIWESDHRKRLLADHENGVRNPTCKFCWDEPWNDVRYLPKKIKNAVLEKLSNYNSKNASWTSMFDYMKKWMATEPSDYSEKQNSFMEFNTKLDNIRKEKFADVFPEYSKLFI